MWIKPATWATSKYCKTYFGTIKWALRVEFHKSSKKPDVFDHQIICGSVPVCPKLSSSVFFLNKLFNMKMSSKSFNYFSQVQFVFINSGCPDPKLMKNLISKYLNDPWLSSSVNSNQQIFFALLLWARGYACFQGI